MKAQVMVIEGCDYEGFPVGGQLTLAKHLIQVFGARLALVGVSTDDTPVGVWSKKSFGGRELDFFSIGRADPAVAKPLIPRRLSVLLRLKRYRKEILSLGVVAAFVEAPEVMLAISGWGLRVCYKFSGVNNPLSMPRYPAGRLIAERFEQKLFATLAERAELILAAADTQAIAEMVGRSGGLLEVSGIVPFRTRVDTEQFRVIKPSRSAAAPLFVTCGRISEVKGWPLLLQAFALVNQQLPAARLCFAGDGEDRAQLAAQIAAAGLEDVVSITGYLPASQIAELLNRSQVFLLGSYREGWPIAVLEALACGLPVVSTRVSGAGDLIEPGLNGYLVDSRDPALFAARMVTALTLENPNPTSLAVAERYALSRLGETLEALWEPLRTTCGPAHQGAGKAGGGGAAAGRSLSGAGIL